MISQNRTNLRLFLVLVTVFLISAVSAENIGRINVFVKDQNGNNVNCYTSSSPVPISCTSQLLGPMKVELFKEDIPYAIKNFPGKDEDDKVFFDVNQSGSYVVRAVASMRFVSEKNDKGDPYSCYYNAPSYLTRVDVPDCLDVCILGGYVRQTCNDSCYVGFLNNRSGGIDDHGYYDCLNLGCGNVQIWDSTHNVYVTVTKCSYQREHIYKEMNEVLTYVDVNENNPTHLGDEAQVTLLTDFDSLGKYGRLYADRVLNLSHVDPKFDRSGLFTITDAGETGLGTALGALDGAMENSGSENNKKFLKHTFSGSFKDSLRSEAGSTIIVLGVESIADPPSFQESVRNWGFTSSGIAASAGVNGVLEGVIGMGAGASLVLGAVISVPVTMGLNAQIRETYDAHMCEHAETDDLDIFIGSRKSTCSSIFSGGVCEIYPVYMVNKGQELREVAIGPDYDTFDLFADCQNSVYFKPYTEYKDYPYTGPRVLNNYTVFMSTGLIETKDVTADGVSRCYQSFNETGRLRHKIVLMPGLDCDFDTWDLSWAGSDIPPISRFQKHKPYITAPIFPSIIHRGDLLNISVGVVYDQLVGSGISISIGGNQYPMTSNSPSTLYRNWSASINTSTYAVSTYQFKILAGTRSVNDNDQRMFEVKVVDDAGSGRDAGSSVSSAVPIALFSVGYSLNESLLLNGKMRFFIIKCRKGRLIKTAT